MQNNPAARLYDITRKLRSTSGNRSPARFWAQALSIPISPEITEVTLITVIHGILAFSDLLNETETGVRELDFDDFYSEVFPPLRQVVQVSLSNLCASKSNLTRPITDETLTLLRVIAAEWDKRHPDPEIDEKVLKQIQAAAHDLFENIEGEDINRDLKRLILFLTSEIEQAIKLYRISGPEGLERAMVLILGHINLNLGVVNKAKANESTRIWWSRFYKIAVKLFEIVKFASDARKTIETISPFVSLIGGTTAEIPPVNLDHPDKS